MWVGIKGTLNWGKRGQKVPQKLQKTLKKFFSIELGKRRFFLNDLRIVRGIESEENSKNIAHLPRDLCGPLDPPPNFRLFLKALFQFCRFSRPAYRELNDQIRRVIARKKCAVRRTKKKISSMSHHGHFSGGRIDKKKSKNGLCYECWKFEKRQCVCILKGQKCYLGKNN